MNLKSIQKNYDLLSMRERFSIFDAARIRDDEREIEAVYAASPQKSYRVVDFYFLRQAVLLLHKHNLIERWSQQTMVEHFFEAMERAKGDKAKNYSECLMLAAYLYVIETDAWTLVGDEFGFDVRGYRKRLAMDSFALIQLERRDGAMREVAFTEDGAKGMIAGTASTKAGENVKTLQSVADMYRTVLLEAEK